MGRLEVAADELEDAVDGAAKGSPGYWEALFVLADLKARANKRRAATRLFTEIQQGGSGHRSEEIALRLKALEQD